MCDLDIKKESLIHLPLSARISYLMDSIPNAYDPHEKPASLQVQNEGHFLDTSLVLLKPEIFPREHLIIEKIESLGYDHAAPQHIYPTTEQWMNMYGYMIKDHPDILQNYLIHRALGLKVITLNKMNEERIIQLDKQTGKAYEKNPNTIRGSVSRKIMLSLGFAGMTGYAASFDPCGLISDNVNPDYVFKCYNGIHTPSNIAESLSNMKDIYGK
jgi:hypothetical protein